MKIAIAGGTGFIGTRLKTFLQNDGHDIIILTRNKNKTSNHPNTTTSNKPRHERNLPQTQPASFQTDATYVSWLSENTQPEKHLHNTDIFINLAGVSINKGRWTKSHQQKIYTSRMQATDELIRIIQTMPDKPTTLINASAIGIYPTSQDEVYNEASPTATNDFLGRTVSAWEQKAKQAEQFGIRTCLMRFGVVLGTHEGALPLMALPYKLFAGGTVGSGNQWLSWVHINDVVRAITFAINNDHLSGPVNVTAPNPLRMKTFGKTIATVLRRPHWIPAPSPAMKLALGKKSKLVLEGQHVKSTALIDAGFKFSYPTLQPALENLLKKQNRS